MRSFLNVTASGRLIGEAEAKYSQTGSLVVRFAIIINQKVYDSVSQARIDKPVVVNVTTFGKQAENLQSRLVKGAEVLVIGQTEISAYVGKSGRNAGQPVASVNLTANTIEIINVPEQDPPAQPAGTAERQEFAAVGGGRFE